MFHRLKPGYNSLVETKLKKGLVLVGRNSYLIVVFIADSAFEKNIFLMSHKEENPFDIVPLIERKEEEVVDQFINLFFFVSFLAQVGIRRQNLNRNGKGWA